VAAENRKGIRNVEFVSFPAEIHFCSPDTLVNDSWCKLKLNLLRLGLWTVQHAVQALHRKSTTSFTTSRKIVRPTTNPQHVDTYSLLYDLSYPRQIEVVKLDLDGCGSGLWKWSWWASCPCMSPSCETLSLCRVVCRSVRQIRPRLYFRFDRDVTNLCHARKQ